MPAAEDISRVLHRRGGRMTRQRRVVMQTLASLDCHPTAQELYELVRERLPRISPATVYRNLKVLQDLGYVLELDYGPGAARYDATVTDHPHARCLCCGRVVDVPAEAAGDFTSLAAALVGWHITGHRLELCGLCPSCLAQNRRGQTEEDRA